MRCSLCGFENRKRAKFCGSCGTQLALKCSECGAEISPASKFCDSCGAAAPTELADPVPSTDDSTASRARASDGVSKISANRRQMSLMCCDLVDSSVLARNLDLEDARYAINNFHQISKGIIEQYEGYYAQYMGDGFMSYFSYPVAHEDDAYRAVLAGLEILEAIRRFNIDLKKKHNIELRLRVGVDTGQVVVDQFVVGEPPNVASRVQAVASPDTIVITETTKRLLPVDVFIYQDLGLHELKNVGPLRLFRVVERQDRAGPAVETRISRPLVGRRRQLELLADHWDMVKGGAGQAVILSGEAGIGKSKLVNGFQTEIAVEAHTSLVFHGSPFHRNTMLHPMIENIQLAAKILPADGNDEKLLKLHQFLRQFNYSEKMLPHLSRLFSITGESAARHTTPQRLMQQTLDILIEMALQQANRGPTLFVFEDIHWFDSTTMNLLELLIPLIRNERAFLLLVTRSPCTPQLQEKYFLTQIALARLRVNEVEHLIQVIAGDRSLPNSVHSQILAKANGVPLYVEELTKMVLDTEFIHDAKNEYDLISEPDLIPLTLRDPLTSRVHRVKGRRVLQLAATLGKQFSYELLLAASSLDPEVLSRELRHLVAAELLYQKGTVLQEATFEFKHSLIRDAAYGLLTKAEREAYHKRVGQLLEERFSETAIAHPEIVAYHYTQAKSYEKATHYWYDAGKQSAARSAHNEAIAHLNHGLQLIPHIDDPILSSKSELLLQTSLGNSLRATKGWSVDDVKRAYTRALVLCAESGLDEHTLPAVFGLWTWNFVRPSLGEAQTLAEHLLNKASLSDDPVYKVLAHEALGFTLFAHGKFAAAHAELERSIGMCEDDKAAAYLDLSAQDPRVHVRLYDAMVLWLLGYPDRALQVYTEARRSADASQDPFTAAMARTIGLRVHQFRGEAALVESEANAAIALCEEHDFGHYLAMALISRGWASAQQGEFEKGLAEMQEGQEKERATGARLYEMYTLGLLADACIKNERYAEAFEFLEQARSRLDEENSERFYAAEIYRLLGEAHLRARRDPDEAERWFGRGLEIAREQSARSLELRLCMSLYDLHESQRDAGKYRAQLEAVYKSFDEGLDTADLVIAKSRLMLR